MKTTITLVFALVFNLICYAQHSNFIHVDQFGYNEISTKVAVISNPQTGFNSNLSYTPSATLQVKDATTNATVFSGAIQQWNNGNTHSQSGDKGWWFNFSSVTIPGNYYIYDASTGETSAEFQISDTVYDEVITAVTKMFYYNRAGIEKVQPYVEQPYVDAISFAQDQFTRDVYDQSNTAKEKDMRGGWFDAGDNNKYVTFVETVLHDLLWAYKENPNVFNDNFNIPESGNGIPDLIDEIKWEVDWLLKMINADGSVHIKMGNRNYAENVSTPPSLNTTTRYYAPTCTSSAIAMASMLAHTAKVFEQFSGLNSYAQNLRTQAELCWNWVLPYINSNTLQTNCDDGSVVAGDADRNTSEQLRMAVTAAVYLFDLTGNSTYNQYIMAHYNDTDVINNGQWENYRMLNVDALLHYTTLSNADTTVRNIILNSAQTNSSNNYNNYFQFNDLDLYRGYCNDWTYHWGSNSSRASMGNLNIVFKKYGINTSNTSTYGLRAKEILHYYHGVNPLDLVHLSRMDAYGAENSVQEIYHFWFQDGSQWDNANTTTYGPAPGYLVGGCNQNYTANTNLSPPYGQPPQKSYLDFNTSYPDNSWEISEPAIYYQAAYLRLLSNVARQNENDLLSTPDIETSEAVFTLSPNPSQEFLTISSSQYFENLNVKISNVKGQLVMDNVKVELSTPMDISSLEDGLYIVTLEADGKRSYLKFLKY